MHPETNRVLDNIKEIFEEPMYDVDLKNSENHPEEKGIGRVKLELEIEINDPKHDITYLDGAGLKVIGEKLERIESIVGSEHGVLYPVSVHNIKEDGVPFILELNVFSGYNINPQGRD